MTSRASAKRRFLTFGLKNLFVLLLYSPSPLHAKTNRFPTLYWHGDGSEKKIALTFDDGPNEPYTSQILQILKDANVRATFFMVGKNVETYPRAARAIADAGHVIGNHSYDHHRLMLQTSRQVHDEIVKAEKSIETATGMKTTFFRPPYGGEDAIIRQQSRDLGYVMVEWSVSADDWRKPGAEAIVQNVMKEAGNGSIILLHDGDKWHHGSDRSQTVQALPLLIAQLRERGFEFVTIPELLKLDLSGPVQTVRQPSTPADVVKKL